MDTSPGLYHFSTHWASGVTEAFVVVVVLVYVCVKISCSTPKKEVPQRERERDRQAQREKVTYSCRQGDEGETHTCIKRGGDTCKCR